MSDHDLTYMLAWESLAEREQKWTAFMFDPEWIAKRAETETSGPIVQTLSNQLLIPTGFSQPGSTGRAGKRLEINLSIWPHVRG